ncbi:MAG: flagellar assembly lytic transglycosylase [Rectinema subterraneum]|uniref:flagellar assembly lytic transglycosylase n=1 Tax=Rectinema subterraneum TaxID=2653714 RepID=UPI003C7994CF
MLLAFVVCAAPFPLAALDPESLPGSSPGSSVLQVPQASETPEAPSQLPPQMLPILTEPADPSGFFFAAEQMRMQAGDAGLAAEQTRLAEFMYSLAFRFAKGPAALEAGRSLFLLLSTQGRLAEAASTAREWLQSFGPDWTMYRNLYDTLMAQGSFPDAFALVSELSKAMPSTAKSRSTELSWMEYNARFGMQDYSWAANGPPFIKTRTPDSYIAKIYRLYAAVPNVPQNQAALALFRAAATERNYADAIAYARPILPTFSGSDTPRAWISELGKSFYGAGLYREGIDFFLAALGFALPAPSPAPSQSSLEAPLSAPVPERAPFMNSAPIIDRAHVSTELSWVMAFYLARMYQGLGENQTAASVFIDLVPFAFSGEDSDSALWYWLDITMNSIAATDSALGDLGQDDANGIQAKRSLELSALSQAAALWKSPSYFEDIVANYMRRLLREGAWNDVVRLCVLMSQKLTASMKGPLLYLSGRLIETGRASADLSTESDFWKWLAPTNQNQSSPNAATNAVSQSPPDSGSNSQISSASSALSAPLAPNTSPLFFQALLRENGIEEHYRTLAAWRLGREPPILADTPVLDKNFDIVSAITSQLPQSDAPPVSDEKLKEVLDFITQSLDYGLEALAAKQVAVLSPFSTDSLLWLAAKFTEHEQYYPALRIGLEAATRKPAAKSELAYALLYPRAWPEHFAELTAPRNIAEPLAYAIVRSESMFNQRAVSRSGAMGLSQLLPGTAAETARGLKMSQYALFDPKDNLTIGLTYYGYMLQRFDGRPARAIAAYNAGPSRMAQWARDWGNLEDDILIELYPVAEPRQYTKNIIAAALNYGKMYYGISSKDMLDFMLAGKTLPQPASVQPAQNAATSAPASVPTAQSVSEPAPAPAAPAPSTSQPTLAPAP